MSLLFPNRRLQCAGVLSTPVSVVTTAHEVLRRNQLFVRAAGLTFPLGRRNDGKASSFFLPAIPLHGTHVPSQLSR